MARPKKHAIGVFVFLALFSVLPLFTAYAKTSIQTPMPILGPYECESGDNYPIFEADYNGVTQVCPAHKDNKGGLIKSKQLYIVIHNTDNQSATAIQGNIIWFQNPENGVSAHYLVGLNDDGVVQVIQLVKESDIANHAGSVTDLSGHKIDNSNSIGIEVVGSGTLDGWPADKVYATVANLVSDIIRRHREQGQDIELNRNYIVGHEEISTTNKPDPGPNWDWQRFLETELGGTYTPVVEIIASRDPNTNEISLSVNARKSTRTHFLLEVSEDENPFRPLSEIGQNGKVVNTPHYNQKSPQFFELGTYIHLLFTEHPMQVCYRARTLRNNHIYMNTSSSACVIVGPFGIDYDADILERDAAVVSQSVFPIVKPGEEVVLSIKMRNTGILSWKPGGRYVFINTGGENFGLETQLGVPQQIWTNEEVEFFLRFKAPYEVGAYTTRWQMAYIDPQTNSIELFGKETGSIVTVLKEGNTGSLAQIIQNIIDNVVQSANQTIEDYLDEIQRRIQEEIDKWFRNWLISICPPLAPIISLVIASISIMEQKRRRY